MSIITDLIKNGFRWRLEDYDFQKNYYNHNTPQYKLELQEALLYNSTKPLDLFVYVRYYDSEHRYYKDISTYISPPQEHTNYELLSDDFYFKRNYNTGYFPTSDNVTLKFLRGAGKKAYAWRQVDGTLENCFSIDDEKISFSYLRDFPSELSVSEIVGSYIPHKGSIRSFITYKMYRVFQRMALIIKPSVGQVPLPWHNTPLYYCSPMYGFEEIRQTIEFYSDFGKGIHVTANFVGFELLKAEDTETWCAPLFILLISKPDSSANKKCCLLECFGITE